MRRILKRAIITVFSAFVLLLALAGAYAGTAFLLMLFPLNPQQDHAEEPAITAWVIHNGWHTDLTFPTRSEFIDWSQYFPLEDFRGLQRLPDYIAIGWGERDFYLHTREWEDLTLGRAFNALFGGSGTLLHTTYVYAEWLPTETYALPLTATQYRQLIDYVLASLALDEGRPRNVANAGYGGNDTFYVARGNYGPLTTCNTWVGDALQAADFPVSAWTPFASNVVFHLQHRSDAM